MLRLIGEVAVWTGLVLLIALGIAAGVRFLFKRQESMAMVPLGWLSFGGALAIAGLSERLGLPQPLVIDIGRREVPVVWTMAGAAIGAAWAWRSQRRK